MNAAATVPLGQLKTEHATIETKRAFEIGHFQMHVPDPHAGMNGFVHTSLHQSQASDTA
jgi:hypothetical protein